MNRKNKPTFLNYLPLMLVTGAVFICASLLFAFVLGVAAAVPVFIFFALVQCLSMLAFALLPLKYKTVPRRISMILIGLTLLVLAGILGKQNFQIEGFLFLIFGGLFGGPIIHFAMKTIGTLFSGRTWCSWGCWSAAVFDFLPYRKNISWSKSAIRFGRYIHFAIVIIVTTLLVFVFGYSLSRAAGMQSGSDVVYWFAAGNLLYYAAGIILAIKMKDNRAFCKYLCPVAVLLKAGNILSAARVAARKKECSGCRECEKSCPAGIAITEYISAGKRIASTECLMCMQCVAVCPEGNLKISLGADFACREYLRKK